MLNVKNMLYKVFSLKRIWQVVNDSLNVFKKFGKNYVLKLKLNFLNLNQKVSNQF